MDPVLNQSTTTRTTYGQTPNTRDFGNWSDRELRKELKRYGETVPRETQRAHLLNRLQFFELNQGSGSFPSSQLMTSQTQYSTVPVQQINRDFNTWSDRELRKELKRFGETVPRETQRAHLLNRLQFFELNQRTGVSNHPIASGSTGTTGFPLQSQSVSNYPVQQTQSTIPFVPTQLSKVPIVHQGTIIDNRTFNDLSDRELRRELKKHGEKVPRETERSQLLRKLEVHQKLSQIPISSTANSTLSQQQNQSGFPQQNQQTGHSQQIVPQQQNQQQSGFPQQHQQNQQTSVPTQQNQHQSGFQQQNQQTGYSQQTVPQQNQQQSGFPQQNQQNQQTSVPTQQNQHQSGFPQQNQQTGYPQQTVPQQNQQQSGFPQQHQQNQQTSVPIQQNQQHQSGFPQQNQQTGYSQQTVPQQQNQQTSVPTQQNQHQSGFQQQNQQTGLSQQTVPQQNQQQSGFPQQQQQGQQTSVPTQQNQQHQSGFPQQNQQTGYSQQTVPQQQQGQQTSVPTQQNNTHQSGINYIY